MIYVIKLESIKSEYNNWLTPIQQSLLSLLNIYKSNKVKCLLLHKYKIDKLKIDREGLSKFCFNNPEKLKLDKLDTDQIILFHMGCYYKKPYEIKKLFDYCLDNEIDLYLPVEYKYSDFDSQYGRKFWEMIISQLPSETIFIEEKDIDSLSSSINRDIKINSLIK